MDGKMTGAKQKTRAKRHPSPAHRIRNKHLDKPFRFPTMKQALGKPLEYWWQVAERARKRGDRLMEHDALLMAWIMSDWRTKASRALLHRRLEILADASDEDLELLTKRWSVGGRGPEYLVRLKQLRERLRSGKRRRARTE